MTARDLRACARAADDWLIGKAIPLWLDRGVDRRNGGFHEALEPTGRPSRSGFKRLRVATRQIYVFTEAALNGVPGTADALRHGIDFVLTRLRHPDGGFASRCDLGGRIIDPSRDLYDLAFTLFAFAHAYRIDGDAALRDEALALARFIEDRLRHPAGGYVEGLPPSLPRRQNPHMHLFEAALACAEHMPHPAFDALCDRLASLFAARLFDAGSGLLFEFYSDDLVPVRSDRGGVVEPGHQFEWAWLLAEYGRVRGRTVAGGEALRAFALRHGLDPATGLLRGALFDDGSVAEEAVRLWPHAEWLKAALVDSAAPAGAVAAWSALARFLETPVPGLWFERWNPARGGFAVEPAPASTLYHLVSAITALRGAAA